MTTAVDEDHVAQDIMHRLMKPLTPTVRDANFFRQALADRFEHARPEKVAQHSREVWFELFADRGEDYVYECISRGLEPTAIATHHDWPVALFAEWWKDARDPARELSARQAAADMAALEQELVFDDPNISDSPQAAANARSRAEAKRWVAERKNPDKWGPPQASVPEQGKVSIILSLDGRDVPPEFTAEQLRKREAKLLAAPAVFRPKGDVEDAEEA